MRASVTSFVPMTDEAETTEDAVLGGRLVLRQPKRGHRFGHDAILLAAATDAQGSRIAVDLGAGVGTAGLALARRVPRLRVMLVEMDPTLAELARENAARNKLADRVSVAEMDITGATPHAHDRALMPPGAVDYVLMNPPYNDAARQNVSPDPARRLAHVARDDTLPVWVNYASRLLKPHGTLTLIWRATGLGDVLAALRDFGGISIVPIHPKPKTAAIRVIVQAVKAGAAPLVLYPPLVLNDAEGKPSAEAEAVLRGGAPLPLQP
jgi:tRNA1(Val) A37 N6-methylase TrmN6